MDIFTDRKLYPSEEEHLKKHFSTYYSTVFISFLPFFKVLNNGNSEAISATKKTSNEDIKSKFPEIVGLPIDNAQAYIKNNEYPDNQTILQEAEVISWNDVISNSGLGNISELNKALKTSIGSYRKELQRPDLSEKLNIYTKENQIWQPTEGCFDVLTKRKIFHFLRSLGKRDIIVTDEFFEHNYTLNLDKLEEQAFIERIAHKDYYIYPSDKEVIFTIDWDSFFFVIATNTEKENEIQNSFEGFLADENTTHLWDWEIGEIDKILAAQKVKKKAWWKRLMD
ncbi:DUF2711 family protein [Roseivirga sp.]|uniref:DUF2711 family protein n=1 Tax=Roseivirga sp. TaxID=1964215 RepID=UPI003B8AC342